MAYRADFTLTYPVFFKPIISFLKECLSLMKSTFTFLRSDPQPEFAFLAWGKLAAYREGGAV
jgi:hypothetical protein